MKKLYPNAIKRILILAFLLVNMLDFASAQTSFLLDYTLPNNDDINQQSAVTASFTVNASSQCLFGNSFIFTNGSTNLQGTTYSWDFGDGSTSTANHPSKSYNQAGNYKIHLEARNGNDFAFVDQFINVLPTPQVSFNTINSTLNGSSFTFTSSSTIESGAMSYFWDLGDNTYSALVNPTKTYTAPGNYNVKLVVTSNFGCKDSIVKVISYATSVPQPPATPTCQLPTAAFTINNDNQCKKNNSFVFTNASTVSSGSVSYVWDFGDGTSTTLTSASKSYSAAGTYQVILVATNNQAGGCSTRVVKNVTVASPEAAFTINPTTLQCLKNNQFQLYNSSHAAFSGLKYQWDLGDGTTSNLTNPVKSYTTAGNFTIRLVTSADGTVCKDTVYKSLTVYPSPNVSFAVSNHCFNNNVATNFTNQTLISGDVVGYEWYFGNGNSSTAVNPSELYTVNGSYNVKLIASSSHGCIDSAKQTLSLEKVTAEFTINSTALQCLKGNNFTFTNHSSSTGSNLNYQWNLAEQTTSTDANPTKTYASAGTYNVQLIAKVGTSGCTDTTVKSLTIYPMPIVDFSTSLITATSFSTNIRLTNASTVSTGNNNYAWYFSDGTSSVDKSLVHQFASIPITQIVKLVATTNNGCIDSISKSISLLSGLSSTLVNGALTNTNASVFTDNIKVYPNPVISVAQVNISTVGNQLIIVTVSDYSGKTILETRQTTNNTNTRVTINLQSLLPGTYFINAKSGNGARLGSQIITKVN